VRLPLLAHSTHTTDSRRSSSVDAAELQLYGPLVQRDAALAVKRLLALATDEGTAPTRERARALFVLGSLKLTGVLEPAVVAWNRTQAQAALQQAAALSLPEARLYAADQLVWRGEYRCEYGLRAYLQPVADELLVQAEQEVHHADVPAAPIRLRERAMDGVAWDIAAGGDGDPFADAAEQQRNAGFDHLARGEHAAAAHAFEAAIAGGDDAYALFNLGFMHMKGLVNNASTPDHVQAEKMLRHAAAKGVGAAYNSLGVMAFNGWHSAGQPNMSAALEWFTRGADAGDPDALFNTGLMHYEGYTGTADMHASVDAFQQAHDAGHWRAPYTLSALHRGGLGTPRSCTQAARLLFTWVEERYGWAAAMDDAVAAIDRGDVGGGVVQLALLSAQGCDAAAANLAFVLMRSRRQLTPWLTRAEALDRAAALLEASARRGASSDARVDLAYIGLERRDYAAAQEHFTAAQNAEGLVSLALMHLRGRGNTTANITHARQLLLQAWERAPDEHEAVPAAVLLALLRVVLTVERLTPALWPATVSVVLAAVRGRRRARRPGAGA
jgi:TPR repeat protein